MTDHSPGFIRLVALAGLLLAIVALGSRASGSGNAAAAGDPVIVAAGDIACGSVGDQGYPCQYVPTSNLTRSLNPDAVLALGDNQYECGTLDDYQTYYDPTWGRFKDKTFPVPGNHEYATNNVCQGLPPGAPGYYSYFGAAASPLDQGCTVSCRGYYSFNLGAWHIVALNSNCSSIGGCDAGSAEETWLRSDLANTHSACVLAYWHHPLFTSGHEGPNTFMQPIWRDLYAAHVSVVMNGHDHVYERFAPQDPAGNYDPHNGIREFIVGTGGRDHTGFFPTLKPNSVAHDTATFGVLQMTLHSTSYEWRFVPAIIPGYGSFSDSGTATCVGQAEPTPTPTATATPQATATPAPTPVTGHRAIFHLTGIRIQTGNGPEWGHAAISRSKAPAGSQLTMAAYVTVTSVPHATRLKVTWQINLASREIASHSSHVDLRAGKTGGYFVRWTYRFGHAGRYSVVGTVSLDGRHVTQSIPLTIGR